MATVVRSESRGLSKPAVYTFLGLASLPHLRLALDASDGIRAVSVPIHRSVGPLGSGQQLFQR